MTKRLVLAFTVALTLVCGFTLMPAGADAVEKPTGAAAAPSEGPEDDAPAPAKKTPADKSAKTKPTKADKLAKPAAPVDLGGYTASGFPTIETQAQFALMLDYTSGLTLLDKNADNRMFPSSMTKMMTSYIIFDKLQKGELKMTDMFPVSENAWRKGGAVSDSSTMFLELGSRATVEDLIRGVVIQSGNDACIVLAEGLYGSEEAFAEEMTKRAKAMGMTGTNFRNSTGYPDPDHYTTARDLAILARHTIEDHPEYYHYYAQIEFTYNNHRQGNRNPLLYRNLGADGLKTGHTEISGFGLTFSALRDGRRVIGVINGLPSMKARATESERLLDWAFREFQSYKLLKPGEVVETADVWLGTAKTVPLIAEQEMAVTLPRRSRKDMKVVVSYANPIPAPIKKGDHIANLVVTAPGVDPIKLPLTAGADVVQLGSLGRIGAALSYTVSAQAISRVARGQFITLEGGEGAGKSTQLRLLADWLASIGADVVTTREPGGSPEAEAIRGLLVGGSYNWDGVAEAFLVSAARRVHVRDVIAPALQSGRIVLCDRFIDSTHAYQGWGRGVAAETLEQMQGMAIGALMPDLTIILDLPVELGLRRALDRRGVETRFEELDRAFHERLRQGFQAIAEADPQRCIVIDANRDVAAVHRDICASLAIRLNIVL